MVSARSTTARHTAAVPHDRSVFFAHWLRNPLGIGAVLPSRPSVGRAMARQLALHRPGAILELGGGTGSSTAGLLAAGCPSDRLIVIERERDLVAVLRRRFPASRYPGLRILEGDARDVTTLLAQIGVTRLASVVSTLPIKWFPVESQRAVLDSCLDLLGSGGVFLQMTNAMVSPVAKDELGILGREVARIWAHFPPVQIWRYWRPAGGR
jgi:phosphatidylethanolamine/phosphatidyl-N-methylethanolamine N-methyltransferase